MKKKVRATYANLSRFCYLRTTPVLAPYVLANKDPNLTTASGNLTQGSNALPDNHGQVSIASRGRGVINPMTVIPVVYRVKLFIFSTVATAATIPLSIQVHDAITCLDAI